MSREDRDRERQKEKEDKIIFGSLIIDSKSSTEHKRDSGRNEKMIERSERANINLNLNLHGLCNRVISSYTKSPRDNRNENEGYSKLTNSSKCNNFSKG